MTPSSRCDEGVELRNGQARRALGAREEMVRRGVRAIAAIALLGTIAAFAADARIGPNTAAASTATPLHEFGYAHGTVSDMGLTDMRMYLDAIQKVTGPGGIVRATVHWDPFQTSGPNWSRYDTFLDEVRARGLRWLPEIHISHSSAYVLPSNAPGGWATWQANVKAIADRYGPNGAYAQAHPGFAGITRYEIWNEPNTGTGNATPTHDSSVDMDPAIAAKIEQTGS